MWIALRRFGCSSCLDRSCFAARVRLVVRGVGPRVRAKGLVQSREAVELVLWAVTDHLDEWDVFRQVDAGQPNFRKGPRSLLEPERHVVEIERKPFGLGEEVVAEVPHATLAARPG